MALVARAEPVCHTGPVRDSARPPHDALTEFRLERISERMRSNRWRNGKTARKLASEWSLSESHIHRLAQEASKRVLAEVTDPEGVTRDVGSAMRKVMTDSLRDADRARTAGDLEAAAKIRKVAVDAGRAWVTLAGLIGRKGPAHGGTMQFATTADAVAFLDAVKADLVGHALPETIDAHPDDVR